MDCREDIRTVKEAQQKAHALIHAIQLIQFDASTAAPKEAYSGQGTTMGMLYEAYNETLGSSDLREAVERLCTRNDLELQEQAEVSYLRERYAKDIKIPTALRKRRSDLIASSQNAWLRARESNDYAILAPWMEKLAEHTREEACAAGDGKSVYDYCLDHYEAGCSTGMLDTMFDLILTKTQPLIADAAACSSAFDDSFLTGMFPIAQQRQLSKKLMKVIGIDLNRCALAEVQHPTTLDFNNRDVRLMTHYYEDRFAPAFFSVLHEGGHCLSGLLIPDCLNGSIIAGSPTSGMGETHSRFHENIIGRSLPFIQLITPILHEAFPQLCGVSEMQFYVILQTVIKAQSTRRIILRWVLCFLPLCFLKANRYKNKVSKALVNPIILRYTVLVCNGGRYTNGDCGCRSVKGVAFMGTSSSDCVEKKVYTAKEVAEMLQWDIRTVYLKCETTTDFKVKRLGPKTVRIDKPSFDAWYDSL